MNKTPGWHKAAERHVESAAIEYLDISQRGIDSSRDTFERAHAIWRVAFEWGVIALLAFSLLAVSLPFFVIGLMSYGQTGLDKRDKRWAG